jgi:hypothetical protein
VRLSDLFAELHGVQDVISFASYLAEPDKDGEDVDLVEVGRVETDYEKGEARIYPASSTTGVDSIEPEPYLGMVLQQLPFDANDESNLRLLVEVPLLREGDAQEPKLVDIAAVHVARDSQEVWFLLRPAEEFAAGLLPA